MRSCALYEQYGFDGPQTRLVEDAAEAAEAASAIGFPVALKVVSDDILHKTDLGAVALDLRTDGEVRQAFDSIMASVSAARPQADVEGVEVQEMVTEGTEIIIGLLDDAQFGPVIMFGLGGLFTEVLKDVSFRVLPIERQDAAEMIREIQGYRVLQGYRGHPSVCEEMLIGLLMKASRMGMDLAGKMESVDFNPIVVWEDNHRVLDFKLVRYAEERPGVLDVEANAEYLETFFKAESVAVIGASATPGKVGNAVLDSLLQHDYRGEVYPVNPTRDEIMGAKVYPSLREVPGDVELVVVTTDLRLVPEVMQECAARDIHNLVIVSGGGKELGGDRAELEDQIRQLSEELAVRVIGPNCIGVLDGRTRLDTFFQTHERMLRPEAGSVAMLTQSGTVGAALLEDAAVAGLGVSKFVSYGNRVDVDEADLLRYLSEDPETDIIVLYVEGFEDGRKFFRVARKVAQAKPVIIFKVGRTQQAARASMSHTGFLGGSFEVARGAFKQAGLIAVNSYEALFAATKALAKQPRANGAQVAMISNGAGTMVQAIDLLAEHDLHLAQLSERSVQRLQEAYPPFYQIANPVDVTGSASSTDYEVGIKVLLEDPQVDIVMPWFVFQDTPLEEDIVEVLASLAAEYEKPILVGAMGGPYTRQMSRAIEASGLPVFLAVRDWVAAARGLALSQGKNVGPLSTQ